MKKLVLIFCLALSFRNVFAQEDVLAKYINLISEQGLKKYLTVIASDEMEGRETGTEGQRKAAAYIETQFKKIGLKFPEMQNGYQQYFPLYQDSLVKTTLVNGNTAIYGKDFITSLNNNEIGEFSGKTIVFVDYGIDDSLYNSYTGINVKGKIVVLLLGEPKKNGKYIISKSTKSSEWTYPGVSKKLSTAASKGAVGVLIINPNQESFNEKAVQATLKTNVYFPRNNSQTKPINNAIISHLFAKKILGNNVDSVIQMAKLNQEINNKLLPEKNIKIKFSFKKYRNIINASNVVGIIEGTDKKDEYVFLTGHYDHLGKHDGKIYYGADDDGSGTCGVLEMAEIFAKAAAEGNRPRRTLVFMTVSGEEKGLWGSEYYSEHPLFSIDKTSVDLNTDMVGRVDTERQLDDTLNYVYVVGHDKLSSQLSKINEAVNKKYTNLILDYKFDDPNDVNRIYYRSDHYNFARKGIPVLFFYDGMLKADYHKPTDTIDKINWDLYQKRVRMIFATAWEIANRDKMLIRDLPLPTGTR